MKKMLLKSGLLAIVSIGITVGSSFALPVLPGDPGEYSWSPSDYWSVTDLGTGVGTFQLTFENDGASYESSFGIYAKGDYLNKQEIFTAAQEPGLIVDPTTSVYFQYNLGWEVSVDNVNFKAFDTAFGFYGDVYDENGNFLNTFYTDTQYNTDNNTEHFAIAFKAPNIAAIYFEDVAYRDIMAATGDPEDYVVFSTDIQPVPEPATMLLFGAGLVGLAGVARRKKMRK